MNLGRLPRVANLFRTQSQSVETKVSKIFHVPNVLSNKLKKMFRNIQIIIIFKNKLFKIIGIRFILKIFINNELIMYL